MKKKILVILSVLLVVAFFFTACSSANGAKVPGTSVEKINTIEQYGVKIDIYKYKEDRIPGLFIYSTECGGLAFYGSEYNYDSSSAPKNVLRITTEKVSIYITTQDDHYCVVTKTNE